MSSTRLSFSSLLDLLRFAAALVVLFFHCRYSIFPGYEAVIIFFVLSGYLISSTVYTLIANNRWSWKEYLIKRMTRLYVVLIPALFLSLFAALLIKGFAHIPFDFKNSLNMKSFLGCLLFLQKTRINANCFALNDPLWSLSFEFWYYMLFPCLLLVYYSNSAVKKFVYGCLSLLMLFLVGKTIALYFIIWLIGFLLFLLRKTSIQSKLVRRVFLAVTFLSALFFMEFNYLTLHTQNVPADDLRRFLIDSGVAFSVAGFLLFAKSQLPDKERTGKDTLWKKLSGFSYTLYLTHYPLMILLFYTTDYILKQMAGVVPALHTVTSLLFFFAIPFVLICCAWLVSRVTEAKTSLIRSSLSSCLSGPRKLKNPILGSCKSDER